MATLASLVVKIGADIGAFETQMTKAQRKVLRMTSDMEAAGQKMVRGVTLPLALIGGASIKAATDFDSLSRGLTAVTGSADKAAAQLKRLQEVAKLPGLGFQEAVQGAINLQAAGLSASLSERSLKSFGNALATVGRGKADLDGVILALGQIASKGKISAEEINQLAERVPQIRVAMQAAFGTADTEVLQKMGIGATQFIDGVVKELEKLPAVTGGAQNAFENFGDAARQAGVTIGNVLLPSVTSFLTVGAKMLEHVKDMNPVLLNLGIGIGIVAGALGPLTIGIASLTRALVTLRVTALLGSLSAWASTALAIRSVADASALLGMAVSPAGAVILGLGALATAFIATRMRAAEAAREIEESMERLTRGIGSMNQKQTLAHLSAARRAGDVVQADIAELEGKESGLRGSRGGKGFQEWQGVNQQLVEARANLDRINADIKKTEGHWVEIAKLTDDANKPPPVDPDKAAKAAEKRRDAMLELLRLNLLDQKGIDELSDRYDRLNDVVFGSSSSWFGGTRTEKAAALKEQAEFLEALADNSRKVKLPDVDNMLRRARDASRAAMNGLGGGTSVTGSAPAESLSFFERVKARMNTSEALALRMQAQANQLQESADRMAGSITGALEGILTQTTSVVEAFRDMVTGIIREIARLAIQRTIAEPISAFISEALKTAVGGGGAAAGGGATPYVAGPAFSRGASSGRAAGGPQQVVQVANHFHYASVDERGMRELIAEHGDAVGMAVLDLKRNDAAFNAALMG